MKKKSTILRDLLQNDAMIVAPGASSALLAKLVENAGFDVVYATGAGIANMQLGVPDVGLATMTEILETVKRINDAVCIPVIADIDNGYGSAVNVYRTAREFSAAGIAGIQLEDQQLPKRCGHFEGKHLIDAAEMVGKIQAAKDALSDKDVVLIARTDAIAVHGFEEALKRGQMYAAAGADLIFIEAPTSLEQLKQIPKSIAAHTMANMVEGGKTPLASHETLQAMGFKMVIYANAPLKAAVKGTQRLLDHLQRTKTTADCDELMITMRERNEITGLAEIKKLEQRYQPGS